MLCRYVIEGAWEGTWRGFSVAVADMDGDTRPEILAFTDKTQVLEFRGRAIIWDIWVGDY